MSALTLPSSDPVPLVVNGRTIGHADYKPRKQAEAPGMISRITADLLPEATP